jgi:hypothetical protein
MGTALLSGDHEIVSESFKDSLYTHWLSFSNRIDSSRYIDRPHHHQDCIRPIHFQPGLTSPPLLTRVDSTKHHESCECERNAELIRLISVFSFQFYEPKATGPISSYAAQDGPTFACDGTKLFNQMKEAGEGHGCV